MWSVPLNTIVYENWWSATVVDGRQEANNHTHDAMYNGTSGMPYPWTSGGWKHRNINSFHLKGCMSTNGQATLELDVESL
jgi:secreted trypsin-like serine protease